MKMATLIDTDVMIDYLRGRPEALDYLKSQPGRLFLPAIVAAELYAGIKGVREERMVGALVSLMPVLPVTAEIAKDAGLLKQKFGNSHGVGLPDAIVAATARAKKAKLATLNVKHYPMFQGLKPAYVKK